MDDENACRDLWSARDIRRFTWADRARRRCASQDERLLAMTPAIGDLARGQIQLSNFKLLQMVALDKLRKA